MRLRLPGFFTHDLERKALALFLALLVWVSVSAKVRNEDVTLRNVPVLVKYDPAVVVVRDPATTVDVTVRGSRRRLEEISSQDVQIVVTVPNTIHEGVYQYGTGLSPKANVKHVPMGVRVIAITPDRVELRIDRIVTKANVPVKVERAGTLREGYEVTRTTAVPDAVTLKGPHRDLLDILSVSTEPILLDDTVVQDFSVTARLVPIPGVQMPEAVRVDVAVTRRTLPRTLHGVPLAVLINPASDLRVEGPLPQVAVTVRGPKAALDALSEVSVCPFADLSAVTAPGRYRRQVNTWITGLPDVQVEATTPASVEITLRAAAEPLPGPPVDPGGRLPPATGPGAEP